MLFVLPRGRIDTLHIVLGDSAGGSIHGALDLKNCGLVCERDPFYFGPLPPIRGLSRWRAMRTRWFNKTDPLGRYVERPPNLRRLRQILKRSRWVHLWAATALSEQLFLAFWATTLRECSGFSGPVRITIYEQLLSERKRQPFRAMTLGYISTSEFRNPPPARPLAGVLELELSDLWNEATAPTPEPLLAYLGEPAECWPRRAARSLLNRYPDIRTGLTRWDEVLLHGVRRNGPNAIRTIGDRLRVSIEDESVGDGWLWSCLCRLGERSQPYPLVKIRCDGGREMRHAEVALTSAGESVLAGKSNAVVLNGIDRWAGGVRLTSADGRLWFRDGDRLISSAGEPAAERDSCGTQPATGTSGG